ncbi:MAG: ABC transporter ATP-binding protein [Proteobacteria bacterium]|nr:ABC transporter ATP-binding protein [Pseudomonadota bacterium]MBI3498069.1 ABC transporter ATP-binding protein [Pseudomonadota bacterium]
MRGLSIDYVNEDQGTRHQAVDGLDLDIYAHEFLCVVGPSGCGKSTLISAISGFLRPTSGTLLMDGVPIRGPGADRGVVFQEYALLPWKTVLDNVGLGLKLRGMPKAERNQTARRYLKLTNLEAAEAKYPYELSGGMKQRAAVARTLANQPQIMLMDEPFAAVDAQTRMTLQEELLRICASTKVTVLFVTHSVEEAVFLADRVAVLSPGPGRLREVLTVNIPRANRSWNQLNNDPDYVAIRDRVLALVRTH